MLSIISQISQLSQIEPALYLLYAALAVLLGAMAWEILKFIGFILSESFKEKNTKKKK